MKKIILFPGRHLLNTAFQEQYLLDLIQKSVDGISSVIFAVTSANQSHSRYNPIPFNDRLIALDRFAQNIKRQTGVEYRILGVPHFDPTDRFAAFIIKEIQEQSEGAIHLAPDNTDILCSTLPLIAQFEALGFKVHSAEMDRDRGAYFTDTPIDVVKKVAEAGEKWKKSSDIRSVMSPVTYEAWVEMPHIPEKLIRLWHDPLLTDTGSLTIGRNYSTYALGMGHEKLMNMKYDDIRYAIRPGKIVDEGCADGALMVRLARDFPDSDIIGIEITSEFTARCEERLRAGEFGGTYVHFHQRNLFERVFADNTIDTTIANSTTHELWSYGEGERSLSEYLKKKFDQTAPGGRLIIRDVVGPESKDQDIYIELATDDGRNEDIHKEFTDQDSLAQHLRSLSTKALFFRFAEDYLKDMRANGKRGSETKIVFREEMIAEKGFIVLKHKDAVEFMTKKDYSDNWSSELNEEFAFWNFDEWKVALEKAGFGVVEDHKHPRAASNVYTNPWVVDNRWKDKVKLYRKNASGELEPMPYPPTNVVLVAEKKVKGS